MDRNPETYEALQQENALLRQQIARLTEIERENALLHQRIAQLEQAQQERNDAEAAVHQTQTLLQTLLDQAPSAISVKDREGTILLTNQHLASLVQATPADMIGKNLSEFFATDRMTLWEEQDQQIFATGTPIEYEATLPIEGVNHTYLVVKFPLRDCAREIFALGIIATDITRRINEQAQTSETLHHHIVRRQQDLIDKAHIEREIANAFFTSAPVGMALLDEQLRYQKINPAAGRINQYPTEEHIGKTIPEVIPTIAHIILPLYQQVLMTGEPIINMLVSGEIPSWPDIISHYDLSIFPVYGDDNKPVGVGGIFMDITERKLAEAALHQSQERLQVLSRRLVAVQERERRALARELHDEIGQILTALNLVLNIDITLPDQQIRNRLHEGRTIINDLMQRVRNLSLDLRPTMLDDMGLMSALQWHFERYTEQTGIQVLFRHSQIERRFQSDIEIAIYRIVQEGLTNVARHANTDMVEVRLLADEERIIVRIDDQGCGFDPQTVLATHATSGLAGMQERAALLGGELTIEAMPDQGTHLIIELPLHLLTS